MTKLISGKVAKVPSANVSADRYEFLDISEAEPDLGLPPVSGYVLAANTNGTRFWTNPLGSGLAEFAYTAGSANVSLLANVANTVLTISNFTTANLIEGINLYYSNARVISAVTPLLTTANVVETTNQYFTNARVTGALVQSNVYVQNLIANDTLYANALILQNINVTSNIISGTVTSETTTSNIIVADSVTSNTWNRLYTANVIETAGNLYFTNDRVISAITPRLTTANVIETTNQYFTNAKVLVGITTGTVVGNITATGKITADTFAANIINVGSGSGGSITDANLISATFIQANTWLGLYTANVVESPTNLYYTNARVLSALTGNVTIGNLLTTGPIVSTAPGSAETGAGQLYLNGATNNRIDWAPIGTGSPTFTTRSTGTKVVLYPSLTGATTDYAIGIDAATMWSSVPEYGDSFKFKWYGATTEIASLSGTGTFTVKTIQANIWTGLYTANVIESPTNLYFTTARVNATVQPFLTTANVIESTNNLYYTNSRVRSALSNSTGVYYNSSTGAFSIGQDVSQSADVIFKDLTVNGNLFLLGNLVSVFANTLTISDPIIQLGYGNPGDAYDLGWVGHYSTGGTERHAGFFRDRTDGKFKIFDNLTTEPGLTEIDTGNVTFRYASIVASTFEGNVTGFVTGQVSSLDNFDTNALKEGSNLYFTNARVVSALIAGQNIIIEANGRISANITTTLANLQSQITNLSTDQIGEGSVNLYYTNSRVISAVTPRLTTANVIETSGNLYFTNSRVVSALTAGDNIIIEANGRISANVSLSIANLQSQIGSLTTDNITEGNTNKYFTNARVLVGITTGTAVGNITATGVVTANIVSANTLSAGTISANIVSANTLSVGIGNGGAITGIANLTATGTITANILSANTLAIGSGAGGTLSGIANITVTNTVTTNILSANTLSIGTGTGGTIAGATLMSAETVSANIIRANTIILQNINVTSNIITGTVSSGTTTSNAILADSVTSNTWNRLYTANVIETAGNLYFTNARVNTVIQPFLTTANVIETASNLYFTNSRVLIGITTGGVVGNIIVTGTVAANILSANTLAIGSGAGGTLTGIANITVTNTVTTNILSANTLSIGSGSGGTIAGANLISATYIQGTNWLGLYTANVVESPTNLFFTNARVVSALIAGQNITIEANGRISANSTSAASLNLTTADVRETSNLYFTNSRVLVGITTGTVVGNITATGIVTANILSANILSVGAGEGGAITGIANLTATGTISANIIRANIIILQNINVTSNIITGTVSSGTSTSNTILADSVTSNTWNRLYTANVIETSGNLYFTNARVLVGITTGTAVGNITATGTITANIINANVGIFGSGFGGSLLGANIISAETISANLLLTNVLIANAAILGSGVGGSLTGANLLSTITIQANSWLGLYTANVIESPTNLFFANDRVLTAVNPRLTTANVQEAPNFVGFVNLYYTNARAVATITPFLTTANVIEDGSNLYFTNARVFSAIADGSSSLYVGNTTASTSKTTGAVTIAGGLGVAGTVSAGILVVDNGSYGNVTTTQYASVFATGGGGNPTALMQVKGNDGTAGMGMRASTGVTSLIYSNAAIEFRVGSIIRDLDTPQGGATIATIASTGLTVTGNVNTTTVRATNWSGIYTANVIETSGNLYFSNTRVIDALVNSNVQVENLFANSTIYANALIIRNISVSDTVLLGSNVSGGAFSGNSLVVDSVTANIWNGLYTANVIETAGNLYFTNARVVSALSAGQNIILASNGQISANLVTITAGENVVLEANGRLSVTLIPVTTINDSARFISTGSTTYTLGTVVNDPKNVLVIVEGLVQLPVVDYTVTGTSLILADAPTVGTNIEVRFFGVDTINSARALSATVDTFVGDGSNVVYTLTSNPPNKNFVTVMIDGIYQQSDVYTLSGKNITFPEAPSLGSNIDIRVIGGAAGSTYNTRTFTANGNVSSFVLTEGFTRDTILVFENGVAQMPLTDYDVVNNSLVFTTPPADNVVVQVRELGISGISAANVIAAIRSLDQVTGNLIPTTNATKDLGSSSKTFNKLYLNQSGLVLSNVSIGATENAITITSSSNVTTTIASTQSISAKAFGLSLIFGG